MSLTVRSLPLRRLLTRPSLTLSPRLLSTSSVALSHRSPAFHDPFLQTPLLSLVNQHLSLLGSSPFLFSPSLFEHSELDKDPNYKSLLEWANLKDGEQGFRSVEVTKVKEGDGEVRLLFFLPSFFADLLLPSLAVAL
jgi:hypothetical protein